MNGTKGSLLTSRGLKPDKAERRCTMNDWIHKVTKWLDYNRNVVTYMVLAAIVIAGGSGLAGCQSRTIGLFLDQGKVTRVELERQAITVSADFAGRGAQIDAATVALNADIAASNETLAAAGSDLDRQDEFRASVFEVVGTTALAAVNGTLNPVSLIPMAIGLLGVAYGGGKRADKKRADVVIAKYKAPSQPVADDDDDDLGG